MADENSSDFRFDGDEQEPESFYHEELKDLRVEKLSQRVTLLTILLPCLTAVALYFGYQDLSGRVGRSNDTGSLEIQRLSKDLEDLAKNFNEKLISFSTTLSTQDKDFGSSIEGRLFAINKNIDQLQSNFSAFNEDLKRDLAQNQDTIEKLKVSKADKKSQAAAIEKITAVIDPIKEDLQKLKTVGQDLKTISGDIKKLESNFTDKLAAAAAKGEQADQKYGQLEASLIKLSDKAIDKDALALEEFKLKKNVQRQLAEAVADFNQRLDAIRKEVDGIKKNSASQVQSLPKPSSKTIPQPSGSTPGTGSNGATLPAPPATITEKDLIE
jgi:DNA repair exonuclease SbcCD ATPase subunit